MRPDADHFRSRARYFQNKANHYTAAQQPEEEESSSEEEEIEVFEIAKSVVLIDPPKVSNPNEVYYPMNNYSAIEYDPEMERYEQVTKIYDEDGNYTFHKQQVVPVPYKAPGTNYCRTRYIPVILRK